ncbi:MAG: thiamine-phosphate kinase [bacterium]
MANQDEVESPPDLDSAAGLSRIGEDGLIERIRSRAASCDPRLIKSIGDDAAVFAAAGTSVATTDLVVQDVHFRLERTVPRLLGRKALSVNLSDVAAMAAVPRFALLGLSAPGDFPLQVIEEILEGFQEKASEAEVSLAGGDVTRSDKLVISVFVLGDAEPPAPVYRSGARPGDHLYITGYTGDSGLGLSRLLEMEPRVDMERISSDPLAGPIMKHLDPEVRLEPARKVAGIATSMIDTSDGIAADLPRLLKESGVPGAEIELRSVPLSDEFKEHFKISGSMSHEAMQSALAGGEDYELLFTAPPEWNPQGDIKDLEGVPLTRIGSITESAGIIVRDGQGNSLDMPSPAFRHFVSPAAGEENPDV